MKNNKKDINTEASKCDAPETRSISEKVHEHLKNKNDHISDADIRNAVINPDENELEPKNENKEENKIITPWDMVDKTAAE